jgi:hypothetical protein
MLYATSKRGRVLERLWVTIHRGETSQTFNVWVYGDDTLHRGAGLFVSDTGLVTSHHFLLAGNESFAFKPGDYDLRVFGKIVGDTYPTLLVKQTLTLSDADAAALTGGNSGVYFDLGAISGIYVAKKHAPMQDWLDSMKAGLSASEGDQNLPKQPS